MKAVPDVERSENGDLTIRPPVASAPARAESPGLVIDMPAGPPEFVIYLHDGKPVLYQRYVEGPDGE